MKSFAVTTSINAAPSRIWALLTDLEAWPSWNSTVPKVAGHIALGEHISVWSTASPGRAFPVRVTALSPTTTMVWTGGMPFGLFTGRRSYSLNETSPGITTFVMVETFTGLLAPLITKSIPDLQPTFDAFAASLKRAAEAGN